VIIITTHSILESFFIQCIFQFQRKTDEIMAQMLKQKEKAADEKTADLDFKARGIVLLFRFLKTYQLTIFIFIFKIFIIYHM